MKRTFWYLSWFVTCWLILSNPLLSEEQQADYLKFGGAFRLNLVNQSYEQAAVSTDTYATFDTWRLNVDARYSDVGLNFEYRFYPTFNTHFIHHGYIDYDIIPSLNMQVGVTRVPFGNLEFNSHSWWFLIPYYVGLEDDYDMGIKFIWNYNSRWDFRVAYFRQAEPAGPSYGKASFSGPGAGTYSYNVIPDEDGVLSLTGATASIHELNQFNLRVAYELATGTSLGVSAQMNGIYNSVLQEIEYGNAWSIHLNSQLAAFNAKLQYTSYDYRAKDDVGNYLSRVQMGAYGDPYYQDGVASKAGIFTTGVSYSLPVSWGPISNILPYVNYSLMVKDADLNVSGNVFPFTNSEMIVPGFMITAGKIYTYVDWAMGRNQPWLTDEFGVGLGVGHVYSDQPSDYYYKPEKANQPVPFKDVKWNVRFNINIGYYF